MHHVMILRRDQTDTLSLVEEMCVAAMAVIWDRRFGNRRRQHGWRGPDSRIHERRGHPPNSWTNLGFLVFEIPSGSQFRVGGSHRTRGLRVLDGSGRTHSVTQARPVVGGARPRGDRQGSTDDWGLSFRHHPRAASAPQLSGANGTAAHGPLRQGFFPCLVLVRKGQPVEFRNSEDESHNVHVVEAGTASTVLNVAMPILGGSYNHTSNTPVPTSSRAMSTRR